MDGLSVCQKSIMISRIFKNIFLFEELRIFRKLKKQSKFSNSQKQDHQILKLKRILLIAKEIEYYGPNLGNVNIEELSYSEFIKLPFLTKQDIRDNSHCLINEKFTKKSTIYQNSSGGSTGEPLKLFQTKEHQNYGAASYHFANYVNGISPYDSMLIFWGALRDMHNHKKRTIVRRLKNYLLGLELLNTYVLSDKIILSYVRKINSYKPKAIKAYVHSFYSIAKIINEKGINIDCKPIIQTSTGPLYPEMKKEIKKAFNDTHVFSFYGSREVSAIATEIPNEESMTVLYDNVFVELINSKGMPARIGDRGIKDDNNSSFGTLRLKSVLGRTLGVIYKADGSIIDGQFFTTLFFNVEGINNFQLIQTSIEDMKLNLMINENFTEHELDLILDNIKKELGNIRIETFYKEKIDLTSTGKMMYVYSLLDNELKL